MRETPPVRVLFIASPLMMGADTWVHLLLLKELARDGCEVHVAAQRGEAAGPPGQVLAELARVVGPRVQPVDFGPSLSEGHVSRGRLYEARRLVGATLSMAGLIAYIRKHRIQVLHATDRPRDAIACVALSTLTGARSVVHVHVKYGSWMRPAVRRAFARAHALVGVSQFVADSLVSGGYPADRVHAVLNCIEPHAWDPALEGATTRRALGVPPDAPLIVAVARIFPAKGHQELLEALALVKREVPEVKLLVVGVDYPAGNGMTAKLKLLAQQLGIETSVIFTGQRQDVASLLAASDVFALPSFEEPFGLVYAEAMAMQKPVVGLQSGGTPEVVEHGQCGLLSAPGDVHTLAANLRRLVGDPELRRRMGEEGRARVEAHFAPARFAAEFRGLYARLITPPG